jgi:esterase/lipase superfamily enzyme
MHVEHHHMPGRAIGRTMEVRQFGHAGQPVVVFPSQNGRAWDFEGFGMIEACAPLIEAGRVKLFSVDGNDWESWTNHGVSAEQRARRHLDYDRWVMEEAVPLAQYHSGRATLWTTGCSMGAYHAANFFFRRPDVFDGVIAISGLYDTRTFVGDFCNDDVYFNSPLKFLPGVGDERVLDLYRRARIAFLVGQGAWEDECLADTRAIDRILAEKGIPAMMDYWGHDVNHDWPWWRKMLPHALERLGA